jgi:hypothetical protein
MRHSVQILAGLPALQTVVMVLLSVSKQCHRQSFEINHDCFFSGAFQLPVYDHLPILFILKPVESVINFIRLQFGWKYVTICFCV